MCIAVNSFLDKLDSALKILFKAGIGYPGELFDVDRFKCRSQLPICRPCGCNVVRAMSTDGPLALWNEITRMEFHHPLGQPASAVF